MSTCIRLNATRMIFVDTSFYIALAISSDTNHEKALAQLARIKEETATSEDVIKETLTIISQRLGKAASVEFYSELRSVTTIIPVTQEHYQAGLAIFLSRKTRKDISIIDCTSTAICRHLKIKKILTFDKHFRSLPL